MNVQFLSRSGSPNTLRLKILVVDDDELNQRLMKILLSRLGHHVETVSNGLEAFEAVKVQRYDVVFMDLQMPVMGGVEASRQIREWESGGSHTFIVALTASYLPDDGQKLFDVGIDNYISKPFDMKHIENILGHGRRLEDGRVEGALAEEADMPANPLFDLQKGIKRVGGDRETYKELLDDFLQGLPAKMEIFQRCHAVGDLEGLSREAHNLKGVSANLGLLQLSECAHRLDKQSSEGYTEPLDAILREIEAVAGQSREIAHRFLSGMGTDAS
jgi:two-component system, sensor histidine kinase and response regulator